jgi:lipoprotein-anchoring transpeptidase ErfK/SrfK
MQSYPLRAGAPASTADDNALRKRFPLPRCMTAIIAISLALAAAGATPANAAHETVAAGGNYDAGTIVIHTRERRLYYYLGDGTALRYRVGVGRAGMQWSGTSFISGKYISPAWKPPADIRREKPGLPGVIAGGS